MIIPGAAGCSIGDDDDSASSEQTAQEKLDDARREGARDEKIKQLERELREKKDGGKAEDSGGGSGGSGGSSGGSAPARTSGPTSCGNGLSAGPNTSCPFASAVRENYPGSSSSFSVYSSVTNRSYTMSCTTGSPHVCRGGNNATVYFP
jgi:hypothetical protein